MLFAHIETGFAIDVIEASSQQSYEKLFAGDLVQKWTVVSVPNGTPHGAKSNGDGTYTNPSTAVPSAPSAALLSASGFQDACETGLGGGTAGATRFGAITRAMDTTADDLVFAVNKRFVKSITFDKTKAAALFSVLVSKGLMTAGERTAILAVWPAG